MEKARFNNISNVSKEGFRYIGGGINLKKGDIAVFRIWNDKKEFKVITDEYELLGRKVVDLEGYAGEVAVEYLKKVKQGEIK